MPTLRPSGDGDADVLIVRRLEESRGGEVSGAALGAELGVSRAAVGRHVSALRRQGFGISARPRRGYRLVSRPDLLVPARVLPFLRTERFGRRYLWRASCGSTSDVAAQAAAGGEPEGLVVVAEGQTGGRGRLGRIWYSPPGVNLYLSLVLRPAAPPADLPPLSLLAGAALAEAVTKATGVPARLKWPNDLLLPAPAAGAERRHLKAAGILVEMSSELDRVRHVVVGIGVNVNVVEFPDDLVGRATSLALAAGQAVDRTGLLCLVLERLEAAFGRMAAEGAGAAVALWRRYADLGGRVRVHAAAGDLEGVAVDVDEGGALRLRDDTGRFHRILAGDLGPPT